MTSQVSQEALLNSGFDALGDDPQIQRLPYRDDGRDDGGVVGVMLQVADEAPINLDRKSVV